VIEVLTNRNDCCCNPDIVGAFWDCEVKHFGQNLATPMLSVDLAKRTRGDSSCYGFFSLMGEPIKMLLK
jgi:hypothetical protein